MPELVSNQLLILAQRPDATVVAGYRAWQSLGRQVRRGAKGLLEPRVLIGGVVRHDVEQDPQPAVMRFLDELIGLVQSAEDRLDGSLVRHVVAGVLHRRLVPGIDPERVQAEVGQVVQPGSQPGDVAHPVAVAVGETADVDLVDHGSAPPSSVADAPSTWSVGRSMSGMPDSLHSRASDHPTKGRQCWVLFGRPTAATTSGGRGCPTISTTRCASGFRPR